MAFSSVLIFWSGWCAPKYITESNNGYLAVTVTRSRKTSYVPAFGWTQESARIVIEVTYNNVHIIFHEWNKKR